MSRKEGERWLKLAGEDIIMAEYAVSKGIFRQACFHAQQAVEKALKAVLVVRVGSHPRGHSLEQLLLFDAAGSEDLQTWQSHCRDLDQYYLVTRYADAIPADDTGPTREDAEKSVEAAKAILADIRLKLGAQG